MRRRGRGRVRSGAPAGAHAYPGAAARRRTRATRHDEAAAWLFAARLQSVSILNRARPRTETVGRTIKRHVWLERRPALAAPAAIEQIDTQAVVPSVQEVSLPLAA